MAAGRTHRSLVGRRRRVDEEGEEDEGPIIVNDSQSEGSVLSEVDEDDATSLGGSNAVAEQNGAAMGDDQAESSATNGAKAGKKTKRKNKARKEKEQVVETAEEVAEPVKSEFKQMADTEAMMNGLRIEEGGRDQEVVEFETMEAEEVAIAVPTKPRGQNGSAETPVQRQRREHEEYRKKRDADPAFVPNRGNFFMHDTRGQQNGQPPNMMRGGFMGRERGRGRVPIGGPFSPVNQAPQMERPAEQAWKHDLHETINEEAVPTIAKGGGDAKLQQEQSESARLFPKAAAPPVPQQPRTINFSSTTLVGRVQIRVLLPGMQKPVTFSEVPWKHYLRLPNHRPPLRRDKPVRVSLPDRPPHYIFPSSDRSFIFIPRQQRPNQYGAQQHRGSYQRSVAGQGYSSRRTSMYGGSIYASSVAASRRSSMAGINRADAFSPASFVSGMPPPNRPLVRLPQYPHQHGHYSGTITPSNQMSLSGHHTPIGGGGGYPPLQMHTYPLPQQPAFQGTPTSTMHQPRPQKAISVSGIESPALLTQVPSNEIQAQPFESQLPPSFGQQGQGQPTPLWQGQQQQPPPYFEPRGQFGYPSMPQQGPPYAGQQQVGTPLSGIPEQAIHAPSFQPPPQQQQMGYGQGQPFYPQFHPMQQQQPFFYPPQMGAEGYGNMGMSVGFMPSQPPYGMGSNGQAGYQQMPEQSMSGQGYEQHAPPPPTDEQTDQQQQQQPSTSTSNMLAREQNGMVFYVPRSDVADQQQQKQPHDQKPSHQPNGAASHDPSAPPPSSSSDQQHTAPQQRDYQPAESFVPAYALPGVTPAAQQEQQDMMHAMQSQGQGQGVQGWYYGGQAGMAMPVQMGMGMGMGAMGMPMYDQSGQQQHQQQQGQGVYY